MKISYRLTNLANYDGVDILSNNTVTHLTFSWPRKHMRYMYVECICWMAIMDDENKSTMISENYEFSENFPKLSFYKSFTMNLPTFQHNEDGYIP